MLERLVLSEVEVKKIEASPRRKIRMENDSDNFMPYKRPPFSLHKLGGVGPRADINDNA
jgi:hypothetical protein